MVQVWAHSSEVWLGVEKGAGIGAAAGAAGGTAIAASKKGEQLQIPSETLLEFRLEQPVALPVAR